MYLTKVANVYTVAIRRGASDQVERQPYHCTRPIFSSDTRRVEKSTRVDMWSFGYRIVVPFLRPDCITINNGTDFRAYVVHSQCRWTCWHQGSVNLLMAARDETRTFRALMLSATY